MNDEMIATIISILILIILFYIVSLLDYRKKISKKRYHNSDEYFYIWEEIKSPLQIGFLVHRGVNYNHIIATLLKFIDRKYIKVKEIYVDNRLDSYEFEKMDLDIFNSEAYYELVKENKNIKTDDIKKLYKQGVTISEIYVINRIIFNDNKKVSVKDIREFYDNNDCVGLETSALNSKYKFVCKLLKKEFQIFGLYDSTESLSPLGIKERKKFVKYSNELIEGTLLKEKELESLIVWGENLALGVALSICEVTIEQINEIYRNKKR